MFVSCSIQHLERCAKRAGDEIGDFQGQWAGICDHNIDPDAAIVKLPTDLFEFGTFKSINKGSSGSKNPESWEC